MRVRHYDGCWITVDTFGAQALRRFSSTTVGWHLGYTRGTERLKRYG